MVSRLQNHIVNTTKNNLMKFIQTYLPFILLATISLTSCDRYLEKKSDTSLVVPSTLDDLSGMMNDVSFLNQNTPVMPEVAGDDFFLTDASFNSQTEIGRGVYQWQVPEYNFPNDWANCYRAVYTANLCLEKIARVPREAGNAARWDFIKGAALFYRGHWFWQLAITFAKAYTPGSGATDPGIVLRLSSNRFDQSYRSSVSESYQQIVSDLKAASGLLPQFPPEQVTQASRTAADAMIARVYLSMGKYDSALYYASLSLSAKSNLLDYNGPQVTPAANVPFKPLNEEMIFFCQQSNSISAKSPSNAIVDSILYRSYETNDLRRTVFFRLSGGWQRFKGSYASHATNMFTGLTTGELYLIKAECEARQGLLDQALETLETLLKKRYRTGTYTRPTIINQKDVATFILLERRKELLFRGLRWMDIKRLNSAGGQIVLSRKINGNDITLVPNSGKYALPLPQDIVELAGIPQNQ
jgi:tetratricopeptide (TPR) repeat protein